jgi:hypothetical protein
MMPDEGRPRSDNHRGLGHFVMPISRLVTAAHRLPAFILFAAIAGAPLPFGSRDRATVAFWCGLLGVGITSACELTRGQLVKETPPAFSSEIGPAAC